MRMQVTLKHWNIRGRLQWKEKKKNIIENNNREYEFRRKLSKCRSVGFAFSNMLTLMKITYTTSFLVTKLYLSDRFSPLILIFIVYSKL